ncbi:MAG TPA: hypothetical protein PLP14_07275 [Chitinophagaceae bacterium]|nr:hypothetical protein [Chitinophagaceae bacterium]
MKKQECRDILNNEITTTESPCNVGMDVVFLIDYTGSMDFAIEGIKSSVNLIAQKIITKSDGDYQIGLAIFDETLKSQFPSYYSQSGYTGLPSSLKMTVTTGPNTYQYLTVLEKMTYGNEVTFANQLTLLNSVNFPLGFGINAPEPGGLLAYEVVKNDFAGSWRIGKKKFCFIITDALDGGDNDDADAADDALLNSIAGIANAKGINFILITTMPSGSNYETQLINHNVGSYKLLQADFGTISNDIGAIIDTLCQ